MATLRRIAVVRAVCRGIPVLDGVHVVQGDGWFWEGVAFHFHNGKCQWVADDEMFPIRVQKLDNISARETYRWKALFVEFLAIYSVVRSKLGFMRNYQKSNDCSTTKQTHAATCGRNMHIHERTPRRSGAPLAGPDCASATHAGCSPPRGRLLQRRGPLPKLFWADLFQFVIQHRFNQR